MENQSIFSTELSTTSNNHIYSASRWARFLGIVNFILAVLYVVIGLVFVFNMDEATSNMSMLADQNPQLAPFTRSPATLIVLAMLVFISILIWVGILFTKMANQGLNYYTSNEEEAFLASFNASKNLFKTISIFMMLYIVLIIVFAVLGALFA